MMQAEQVQHRGVEVGNAYAVFNGGKRVRPLLTYAAGECFEVEPRLLDAPAVAIELIHAFSLVHDDLPAMDNDDLRRGKPTVHKQYDEATAILAADALQPLAFSVLSKLDGAPDGAAINLVQLITEACGSTGMTGGQSIDLVAEGQALSAADLEHMYALKTGALIHASIVSACLLRDDLATVDFAALEVGEQLANGLGLRHDDRLPQDRSQLEAGGVLTEVLHEILDVENADDVIEVLLVDGDP